MDWSEYLRIAQELHDRKGDLADEEACCRAAISRAYYAAFNKAAIRLETAEHGTQGYGGSHQKIINYYKDHTERTRSRLGLKLDRLKDRREESDYEYYLGRKEINNYPYASGRSLKDATEIINLIELL